ncbi:MAG: hypothetical protein ACUVWK_06025 [Nitrososphaerales archaeon]
MPSKSTEALSKGVDTSTKNFGLFVPMLAPLIIHLIFLILAYVVFPTRIGFYPYFYVEVPNPWLIWGGYFIASIIWFIVGCMIVDMANDIINGRPMNMNKSMKVVTGRMGTLFVAAIISAIFFLLFFLIPVALFIITIAIIEGTDAIESTKRSFDFVVKNLGEVIVFVIIVIVVEIILGIGLAFIPVVGAYLGAIGSWILNVIFTVAAVYFYLSLRQPTPPPPPPPPQ